MTDVEKRLSEKRSKETGVKYKYVLPRNTQTEMYTGRVACCPLVSYGEYALQTL